MGLENNLKRHHKTNEAPAKNTQRLKNIRHRQNSSRDASLWMFQEVTKQEARVTNIATQAGFNRGFTVGLFSGFILCVFIWTVFISHRS